MRQNLREKTNRRKINYADEMQRIENIFSLSELVQYYKHDDYTHLFPCFTSIEDFFNKCMFVRYPYSETYINIDDMRYSLCISKDNIKKNDLNIMLDYFEFIFNIMNYFINNYKNYNIYIDVEYIRKICHNIQIVLDKLNYQLDTNSDYIYIVEKDAASTAIAEIYDDIANKVIEYRRHNLKGNIERKCEILNSLSNKFEVIRENLKSNNFSEVENKTGNLLNNLDIRHNNKNGKYSKNVVINMTDAELEQWYDRTFDMILMCLMFNHYLDFRDELKTLNENLKKNN